MKTCKQKALEWGISERTVNDLCKKGRIPGAVKNGGRWQIPDEAIKPEDGRISSGRYVKTRGQEKLRRYSISERRGISKVIINMRNLIMHGHSLNIIMWIKPY